MSQVNHAHESKDRFGKDREYDKPSYMYPNREEIGFSGKKADGWQVYP